MIEKTKDLINQLSDELEGAGELDPDTDKLLQDLRTNLEDDSEGIMYRVKELEARFAARYPTAERISRSIIDSLGKMGI